MTRTASDLIARLSAAGETVGCAESLTGGLLVSRLVDVPGASAVVRGAVVAYATDLKATVLGVDADLLAREGAVHPDVARQMATGVRRLAGATWGLATTGVAGPDPQDGQPVGTVFVAVSGGDGRGVDEVRALMLPGDRQAVRAATVEAVLDLLSAVLGSSPEEARPAAG